jgi:hypothetical protein
MMTVVMVSDEETWDHCWFAKARAVAIVAAGPIQAAAVAVAPTVVAEGTAVEAAAGADSIVVVEAAEVVEGSIVAGPTVVGGTVAEAAEGTGKTGEIEPDSIAAGAELVEARQEEEFAVHWLQQRRGQHALCGHS